MQIKFKSKQLKLSNATPGKKYYLGTKEYLCVRGPEYANILIDIQDFGFVTRAQNTNLEEVPEIPKTVTLDSLEDNSFFILPAAPNMIFRKGKDADIDILTGCSYTLLKTQPVTPVTIESIEVSSL